jgi:hypothetical protein
MKINSHMVVMTHTLKDVVPDVRGVGLAPISVEV